MRTIIKRILASRVPTVGYVSPSGAHAASAGTYILYSTNIAAMAPGTNIGAATPIQIGSPGLPGLPQEKPQKEKNKKKKSEAEKPLPNALAHKILNDSVSFIRALAVLRKRNADWAEKAVRDAATLHATQALKKNVIEIIATDLSDLLTQLDGKKVDVGKNTRALSTHGAMIEHYEPDTLTEILGVITNPQIAFILMMIGMYGLIFELANPGNVVPGVIGAISLVLALYAFQQLPLNYAGLALLLLGIAFMVAEAFSPSFGVLGVGGIVAFIVGAAMLIDTDIPEFQLSWGVILSTAAISGAFLILLLGYLWHVYGLQVQTGQEQMIGSKAIVVDWAEKEGSVWLQGERWSARGDRAYAVGEELVVKQIDGLTLIVTTPALPEAE
jgi:membrane-bound serine protease (ClpP class)